MAKLADFTIGINNVCKESVGKLRDNVSALILQSKKSPGLSVEKEHTVICKLGYCKLATLVRGLRKRAHTLTSQAGHDTEILSHRQQQEVMQRDGES